MCASLTLTNQKYFYAASPQSIKEQACYDFKSKVYRPPHQTQAQIRKSQSTLYTITHLDISFFQLRYQYKAIKHHPKRHLLIEGHLLQDPNLRTNKNIAVGIFVGQTLGEAGRFICKQHRARRYLKQLSNIGFWELNAHTFDSWSSSF